MIKYTKPYPTIGQLIKNKNYDYVEYRVHLIYPNSENKSEEDELGEFTINHNNIIYRYILKDEER